MEVALLIDAGVFVVNAGSSSLKLRLIDQADEVAFDAELSAEHGRFDRHELADALTSLNTVGAVGHRIVHGGTTFTRPVLIDSTVRTRLESLSSLAPLHQPPALAALDVIGDLLADVPAIACFDTAFHASIPEAAATYAIPAEWRERHAIRRYGFHGLSHAYAARRAAQMLDRPLDELRIVTCHLGAGASLAAVRGGTSIDTTMGFTPLEGLVMATRSGTIDPGIIPWLQRHAGLAVGEIADALEHRSGLAGLAGTSDMREVIAAMDAGDVDARLAIDVYVHRLCGSIGAMAASLEGLDVIVFTGRVGERAATIRESAARRLRFLGAELNVRTNATVAGDADVSSPGAAVRILVVESREDLEIARQVREVLRTGA